MEKKDILYPLRCVHGFCHEWFEKKKKQFLYEKYLGFDSHQKCLVIGTPEHNNIGDSAIALAELSFLERYGVCQKRIREITAKEYEEYTSIIRRRVKAKDILIFHGGGNLGDQWLHEELLRRDVLSVFTKNPFIIFPQTIYYTDTPIGRSEQQKSVSIYNGRKNLTMVAREKKSYDIMQKLYPGTPVLLTPDIVLSANGSVFGLQQQTRQGVLLCFRNDAEQAMTPQERQEIETFLHNQNCTCRITDMYADGPVTKENRRVCVQKKFNAFASAELVITDRLHGMVFAAIAETPCIVFGNYNQKVEGTYEWIKYLPYIRFVKSTKEAERAYAELKDMKNCKFDNAPLAPYFEKLAELVKQYAAN